MWASRIGRAGRRRSAPVIALFSCLLAACTSVSVDREMGAMEQLPAPDRVLVYNFAVTPQEVQLDAVGSAITSTLDGTADWSRRSRSATRWPMRSPSGWSATFET